MKTYLTFLFKDAKCHTLIRKKFILPLLCLLIFQSSVIGENIKTSSLAIEDDIAPIAICQDFNVLLDFSGTKAISPQNVNGGSFDPDGSIVDYSLDKSFFTCDDLGVNVVTLTVEDNDGDTASCTATVTVSFPSQTLACISQVNLSLDINGNGTLEPNDVLAGPIIDPCGLFTVTPSEFTCDDIGQHTVIVEDGVGNSCWLTVLVEDKIPPTFIFPEDVTVECNGDTDPSKTGEPVIIDNCGIFSTTYFDQTITIIPENDILINRIWTIIDSVSGDTVTHIQVLDLEDDQAPVAICASNINISLDQFGMATLAPEAVDAGSYDDCGDVSLSVSPSTFDCSNIGESIVVFLTVTDEGGNTNQCWTTVLIEDKIGPTAVCNSVVNVTLESDGIAIITPADVDAGSYDNCGPVTLTLDQTTFDCDDIDNDSLIVFLTVTDGSGNTNICWAEVNVEGSTISEDDIIWPDDIELACNADTDPSVAGEPFIQVACAFTGVSYQDDIFALAGNTVKILRYWTVIDWLSGEIFEYIQIIKTIDNNSPFIACNANVNLSLDATGNAVLVPEAIVEGSVDDCGDVTLSVSPSSFDCSNVGESIFVTATATDESGNTSTCWTYVLIEDKIGPTAICNSVVNVSLGADGTATITPDMIDAGSYDNCGPVTLSLDQTTFDCSDIDNDSLIVFMTVTDASGNTNLCWTEIVVEDNLFPDVIFPVDVLIGCNDNTDPSEIGEPVIVDNCGVFGVAFEDQIIPIVGDAVKILRTWTVIDWYTGEIVTHIQVIKTEDNTPPTPICFSNINVSLDATGNVILQPESIDAGSYDDCGDVTLSVSPSTFDCSDIGSTVTVTLTVTDESGNADFCLASVNIEDKMGPVAVCNSVVNISLGADGMATITPDVIDAGSYDNCGPVTFTLSQSTFDCSDIFNDSLIVFMTVTDGSGNTNQCWTEIIVEDKLPPVVTCPQDGTIDCELGISPDPDITGWPTVEDNCDFIGFSYEDQVFPLGGPNFKIIRTWIIVDWYSQSYDTCYQIIKSLDTNGPIISCALDLTVSLDNTGSLTLSPEDFVADVFDYCDSTVTLTVNKSTFDCSDIGTTTFNVQATDGSGNISECFSEITILDTTSPVAICNSVVNVSLGADGTATITPDVIDAGSYDNCGPVTLSLDQTTFDCSDILNDSLVVILTVTDASGNTNQCWTSINVEDKLPVSVICPPDLTLDCSQGDNLDPSVTGFPTIIDNCDLTGFTYEDQYFQLGGASLKIIRKWTVVDWNSLTFDSCFQVIKVLDTTAPELVCLDQLTAALDNNGSLTLYPEDFILSVTDDCDSVTYSITQDQFDCSDIGTNSIVVTAIDGSGNLSECTMDLTLIDNTPPTPFCLQQVNISLGADGTATITPEDIDAGSFDGCGGPVTLSLDQTTFDCSDILNDSLFVILTVTDESGNSDFCYASITVEDNISPRVTCPFDLTIECSQAGNLDPILTGSPYVEDNCGLIGYSYEDTVIELDGANYKVIRDWIIVDWYSNSFDSCTQVITVLDITPPIIVCLNQLSASLDSSGSLTLFPQDLDAGTYDECGTFDLSISQSEFDCTDVGSNNVTLTATDENGNSSQCIVEVVIFGLDADADGFSLCDGDCDDNNASISPGTLEVCGDNIDNNCDGNVDENCICASFAESTEYEWIETVDANGTSNNSGDDGGYGDYTAIILPMNIGSNSIELTPGFAGSSYNEFWSIWIDLNQNGQYEASEEVLAQNSSSTISSTINIPASALLGTTSMRVSMKYGQSSDPCEIFAEGEVEDYTVEISPPLYCISEGASTQYEWIKRVRLKSINNLSGNDNGYADFTNLSTSLNPGQSRNIILRPGFSGSSYLEYWSVWVDWNDDGDFDDAGELEVQTASSGNVVIDQITVPNSASSGDKRMRVSMKYGGYSQPCETFTYGEVEDYTIFVTGSNPLVSDDSNLDLISVETQTHNISNEVIDIRAVDPEINVHLYPNPTSNFINIEFKSSSDAERKLTMYNEIGQSVYQTTIDQNSTTIDITPNKFMNGLYVLMIQQGEQVISKRVIISK